jgi:LysM repeat protein
MGGRILIAFGRRLNFNEHRRRLNTDRKSVGQYIKLISLSKAVFVIVLGLVSSGCPHYSSGLPPSLRPSTLKRDVPATGIFHIVKPQENLSGIAKAYDVDLQVLAEVNNLKPPYTINANSKIFVPEASEIKKVEPAQPTIQGTPEVKDFSGLLMWPVDGKIISEFGVRGGTQYNGITIQAAEDTPVRAAAGGRVGHVGNIPGYGNVILMEHANRRVTVYAHLKEIKVSMGDVISQKHVIGTVGTSGRAEEPNLYFEVRSKSKPRNPLFFLERKSDTDRTG